MSVVNHKKNEIQVKVVYYGPGRGGKTTNLEYIFAKLNDRARTDLIAIKTQGDRTLFFDFLPFDMGKIMGYDVKVQLYTVPGQVKYNATRKVVLRGVDGIVFVADSLTAREKNNLHSLKNLHENLKEHNKNIFKIPLVLQYNKRDLEEQGIPLLSFERMEKVLNSQLKAPSFLASALSGEGVVPTMKQAILMTINSIKMHLK